MRRKQKREGECLFNKNGKWDGWGNLTRAYRLKRRKKRQLARRARSVNHARNKK